MKTVFGIILLILVSTGMLTMLFNIQSVKAAPGTIYIMPDGSINPSTANITTSDNVTYTFTDNNYLPIVVNRSNIIINGRGHTLQALWGIGFSLPAVSNVTIKNTTITNCWYGIFLYSSSGNILSGNNVTANGEVGIWLNSSSDNNTLSNNNVTANSINGIVLSSSDNNTLSGNNVTASLSDGIFLFSSDNSTLSGNNATANGGAGIHLYSSSGNVLSSNNATSNISGGIFLDHSSDNNMLSGNDAVDSDSGIVLSSSDNNALSDNYVTANSQDGIYLVSSSSINVLSGNNATANGGDGIYLSYYSDNNTLSGNDVVNNSGGAGIDIFLSSFNAIFHNVLLSNAQQARVSSTISNIWDDGYPSGGNYWGDYPTRYPNAAENGSSGIWSTPYVIGVDNTDRYPLMASFHTFDVGTWNGTAYSVGIISNSSITNFSFNQPAKTLNFNVTGTNGTMGLCRVAIPKKLMWCANLRDWTVIVNGTQLLPPNLDVTTGANNTYIYFTYHQSTETVQIQSTNVVSEFQPFMLLSLLIIITALIAIIFKRKRV
jgi:parallel beta-helix repeat protein